VDCSCATVPVLGVLLMRATFYRIVGFIGFIAVWLLVYLSLATAAHAVEMPKELQGTWCRDFYDPKIGVLYMLREECKETTLLIHEKGYGEDEGSCELIKILSVKEKMYGSGPEDTYKVRSRCRTLDGSTKIVIHELSRYKFTLTVKEIK
jgi:hypothetical protein